MEFIINLISMSLERLNELKAKGPKTSPAEKAELKKLKEELLQQASTPAEPTQEIAEANKRAEEAEAKAKVLEAELAAAKATKAPVSPSDEKAIEGDAMSKVNKLNAEQKIVPVRYDQKCLYLYPGNKKCERTFGDVLWNNKMIVGCPTNDPKHHVKNGTLPPSALPEDINLKS